MASTSQSRPAAAVSHPPTNTVRPVGVTSIAPPVSTHGVAAYEKLSHDGRTYLPTSFLGSAPVAPPTAGATLHYPPAPPTSLGASMPSPPATAPGYAAYQPAPALFCRTWCNCCTCN